MGLILQGDCLEVMKIIPANSVDMVLCDLPYGYTRNQWDLIIPMAEMWEQYRRVCKPGANIVLHGYGIFSAKLILSAPDMYRYSLVWEKGNASGHLNAKRMPLRAHEDIIVFYDKPGVYNPQKTTGHPRKVSTAAHKRNSKQTDNYGAHGLTSYDSTERYPRSVLKFSADKQKSALHPTQKPVGLEEYLIETYSNKGMVVLDNASGSGTTGIAAINTGRDYILIEKDPVNFEVGKDRVLNHEKQKQKEE